MPFLVYITTTFSIMRSDPICTGNFIFQNYRQALEKIAMNSENLAILANKLGTTAKDYESYLASEREYLKNLRLEPPEVVQAAEYVDHLAKLYRLQYVALALCTKKP